MSGKGRRGRSHKRHTDFLKGGFPQAEDILYDQFKKWRHLGYQVDWRWFWRRMIKIMRQCARSGLDPGYDPVKQMRNGKKYCFGRSWVDRYKKTQKKKSSDVKEPTRRIHVFGNVDRKSRKTFAF